jgi:hypothetical protein
LRHRKSDALGGGTVPEKKDAGASIERLTLREAIDRFKSYLKAGEMDALKKTLGTKNISASTIRNWAKDPKKLETSYRRSEFADAIGMLADLDVVKRNDAYEFALKELGLVREGQHDLANYDGAYRVFHDFRGIELNNFVIKVEHSPFVVIFVFRYNDRNGRRGECDGLIVSRHGKLVCAGFSPTTVFQAAFHCVGYPRTDIIRGMAFIEDLNTQEISFSTIAITRDSSPTAAEEATILVRGSGHTL